MQGLFLIIYPLPSRLLSRSAAPVFWGYVVRAYFWNIWYRSHPLSRQIGWGAIYGAINQVLWLPYSIPHSWVVYTESHWRAFLTELIHSIHGESQSKSIHSGLIAWDYIPQLTSRECPRVLCAYTQVGPLGFGGKSILCQIRQSAHFNETWPC